MGLIAFLKGLFGTTKESQPEGVLVDLKIIDKIDVVDGSGLTSYNNGEISEKLVNQLWFNACQGKYNKFIMQIKFKGKGTYIKKLDKTIYEPYESTLAVLHENGSYICAFFAGDTKTCHILIGDPYSYSNVDSKEIKNVTVGEGTVKEYGVVKDSKELESVMNFIFEDSENVSQRMSESRAWGHENYKGGWNLHNKCREKWANLPPVEKLPNITEDGCQV